MVRRHALDDVAEIAEAVEVGVADLAPVAKLDAQLERTLCACNEVGLVDTQQVIEQLDMRDGGLDRKSVV